MSQDVVQNERRCLRFRIVCFTHCPSVRPSDRKISIYLHNGQKKIMSDWPVTQLAAVTAARKPGIELTAPDIPCESNADVCVRVQKNNCLCFTNANIVRKVVGCGER
jgi:hypothetical protein